MTTEIKAPQPAPRFANVSCSQCGREFGPGDSGFSHCQDHRPAPTARLVERLLAEADLCRNDGAHDIANLLDEAAAAASDLAKAAHGVVGLARLAAARLSTYRAAIDGLSERASRFAAPEAPCTYPKCAYPCDRLPDCNETTGAQA